MACQRCRDTGLLPFRRKDGTIVPHAWINCPDCYQEPIEHYHPIHIEDFDFAMSGSIRAWTYQYCGVPDPGYVQPQADISELQTRVEELEGMVSQPGAIPKKYKYQLQQLNAQVLHLQNKLDDYRKQRKSNKGKY